MYTLKSSRTPEDTMHIAIYTLRSPNPPFRTLKTSQTFPKTLHPLVGGGVPGGKLSPVRFSF